MVGLTGGIGSGKSTVAALLAERGAIVVDADAIAREVVEPGMPALTKLADRFGDDVIREDGTLDRAILAERAFVNDESKKDLEAITHPAIGEEFLRRVAASPPDAVVVHDVPLLVESTRGYQYDAVIVYAYQSGDASETITVRPADLQPDATYAVRSVDTGALGTATGADLMANGVEVLQSPNTAAHILVLRTQ